MTALPPPTLVPIADADQIYKILIDEYVADNPEFEEVRDLRTTPEARMLRLMALREALIIGKINARYASYLVDYAYGAALEALAALFDVIRLAGEQDRDMQRRLKRNIAGRSPAGPRERYEALAMNADVRVRNAKAYRLGRSPRIYIALLSHKDGGVPTGDLLDIVRTAVSQESAAMLIDRFDIVSAIRSMVNVEMGLRVRQTARETITTDVEQAISTNWEQTDLLGNDLTRAWLTSQAMAFPDVTDAWPITPEQNIPADDNEALSILNVKARIIERGR
ncbi:baseplate J/gp47 family protein [Pseudovibrio ascidiaceicola]|uniref:baseplate J/gp47 family protein n=1 Tax=Pseudovibrio ascidiaceicola TaxID=285279 RepID=UPI003D368175